MLEVFQLKVLDDNFIYVIRDEANAATAVVDPATSSEVNQFLDDRGWKLDYILNTHHHPDHVGGNKTLKEKYKCKILGPKEDQHLIPEIDQPVSEKTNFQFGSHPCKILDVPGHTNGHIAYLIDNKLFCGDTLFSLGCGRVFSGTAEQLAESLNKIYQLPDDTLVFCAHEYTLANAEFHKHLAEKYGLNSYLDEFDATFKNLAKKRMRDLATVPSKLAFEKKWNFFLRLSAGEDLELFHHKTATEAFTDIRRQKDQF